jgi:hypothetical protein
VNIVAVSTFRRPFHTRLCLESICRAQRWYPWANKIAVCVPANGDPLVTAEILRVTERNSDIRSRLVIWNEDCESNAHAASKWILDTAFTEGAEAVVYTEDDAVLAPDAFAMCEFTRRYASYANDVIDYDILGCCLYHETILTQYAAENRSPDPALLHLSNGLNTCGGTMFLREPYLRVMQPEWNCKQVEPRGFDYSAHYLMYLHNLYMVWPDLSRSHNIGFDLGSCSPEFWAKYFGKSIWTRTRDAQQGWDSFKMDPVPPRRVREEWMEAELKHRGLL